jgi:hypothetical protein
MKIFTDANETNTTNFHLILLSNMPAYIPLTTQLYTGQSQETNYYSFLRSLAIFARSLLPQRKVTTPIPNKYLIVWNMFSCSQNIPNSVKIPVKKHSVLGTFWDKVKNSEQDLITRRKSVRVE